MISKRKNELIKNVSDVRKNMYSGSFNDTILKILEILIIDIKEIKEDIKCIKKRQLNVPVIHN